MTWGAQEPAACGRCQVATARYVTLARVPGMKEPEKFPEHTLLCKLCHDELPSQIKAQYIPIGEVAVVASASVRRSPLYGVLTPQRKAVFEKAMALGALDKLERMAAAFEAEGLPDQARALRERIELLKGKA